MTGMYDLHTHTILSDGELLPIELIRRMSVLGYETVAITDHVDATNTVSVIKTIRLLRASARLYDVSLLCGVEITHVPPSEIPILAEEAKMAGADIVTGSWRIPRRARSPGNESCRLFLLLCRCACAPGSHRSCRCKRSGQDRCCAGVDIKGRS